ncbi:unnamed protein product, partial [Timema podura]|nr:unnamed protein product [Timema podura]
CIGLLMSALKSEWQEYKISATMSPPYRLYIITPPLRGKVRSLNTCFEITSLVGTICSDGAHLHITLGDPDGNTVSGHLVGDAVVETTAEVVLGEILGVCFNREHDPSTGFRELSISRTMRD